MLLSYLTRSLRSGARTVVATSCVLVMATVVPRAAYTSEECQVARRGGPGDDDNPLMAPAEYERRLKLADKQIFESEFELELLLLLDDKLEAHYSTLTSLQERKAFVTYFWEAQNPNPILAENDRLLTHLKRRSYAKKHFPLEEPPYFDRRGEYYLKYGPPQFRFRDHGGPRKIKTQVSIAADVYSVRANESWSYVNVAPDFVVHFAEETKSFVEIESLRDVIIGNQRRGLLIWYWSDLLRGRFWMSPLINDTVSEIVNVENQILMSRGGRPVVFDNLRIPQAFRRLLNHFEHAVYDTHRAGLNAPSMTYEPQVERDYELSYDIAQFRGDGGKTRLEIAVMSPVDKFVLAAREEAADSLEVEFTGLLRDDSLHTIVRTRVQRRLGTNVEIDKSSPNLVASLALSAPALPVDLSLQIKDNVTGKIGFSLDSLAMRDFTGDSLMMSDLQFLMAVDKPDEQPLIPVFEKQQMVLAPYPFRKVKKAVELYCYFEVYNLGATGLDTEYELRYSIYAGHSAAAAPTLSVSQLQLMREERSEELMAIDLTKLAKGPYILQVSISHGREDAVLASVQKAFVLAK